MFTLVFSLLLCLLGCLRTRAALQLEILALRHQVLVLRRSTGSRRLRLQTSDRLLWVWLSQLWSGWRSALLMVKPETVIAWHRRGFRLYWTWKSRARVGRPGMSEDVRDLIRRMSLANPLWGAPRIHGELIKLGIDLSQATVAKYMVRHPKPPSQNWRTFLENHVKQLVSIDFFTVPPFVSRSFTFFWCWLMTGVALSTSMRPHIPPRNGPGSNYDRLFRLTNSRATCSAIVMPSSGLGCGGGLRQSNARSRWWCAVSRDSTWNGKPAPSTYLHKQLDVTLSPLWGGPVPRLLGFVM